MTRFSCSEISSRFFSTAAKVTTADEIGGNGGVKKTKSSSFRRRAIPIVLISLNGGLPSTISPSSMDALARLLLHRLVSNKQQFELRLLLHCLVSNKQQSELRLLLLKVFQNHPQSNWLHIHVLITINWRLGAILIASCYYSSYYWEFPGHCF